jgi:hypothetical protein
MGVKKIKKRKEKNFCLFPATRINLFVYLFLFLFSRSVSLRDRERDSEMGGSHCVSLFFPFAFVVACRRSCILFSLFFKPSFAVASKSNNKNNKIPLHLYIVVAMVAVVVGRHSGNNA